MEFQKVKVDEKKFFLIKASGKCRGENSHFIIELFQPGGELSSITTNILIKFDGGRVYTAFRESLKYCLMIIISANSNLSDIS